MTKILYRLVLPGIGAGKNASLILLRAPQAINAGQNEVLKLVPPGIGAEEAS